MCKWKCSVFIWDQSHPDCLQVKLRSKLGAKSVPKAGKRADCKMWRRKTNECNSQRAHMWAVHELSHVQDKYQHLSLENFWFSVESNSGLICFYFTALYLDVSSNFSANQMQNSTRLQFVHSRFPALQAVCLLLFWAVTFSLVLMAVWWQIFLSVLWLLIENHSVKITG